MTIVELPNKYDKKKYAFYIPGSFSIKNTISIFHMRFILYHQLGFRGFKRNNGETWRLDRSWGW